MTDNPNRIPFKDMPREDQDRIAGAIARGETVEWFAAGSWILWLGGTCSMDIICRIPPTIKPAKDPNRPRPAHKLNLRKGDVVELVKWEDGDASLIGEKFTYILGGAVQCQIDRPLPKGQRPLFVVIARANGGDV